MSGDKFVSRGVAALRNSPTRAHAPDATATAPVLSSQGKVRPGATRLGPGSNSRPFSFLDSREQLVAR